MSQKWVAMFDCKGIDVLIPCDRLMTEEMMRWMGGEKYESELCRHVNNAILRAKFNHQRFPEVWVYDTEEDIPEDTMRKMWEDDPKGLAKSVREKGRCLFKSPPP